MFVRRYNTYKYRSGERIADEQIDLNTVYYPSLTRDFTAIKYIDTWRDGKLRYGNDHYVSKTRDLRGNSLRLVMYNIIVNFFVPEMKIQEKEKKKKINTFFSLLKIDKFKDKFSAHFKNKVRDIYINLLNI